MKTDKEKQREMWRKASLKYYYKNREDCIKRSRKYHNMKKESDYNNNKFKELRRNNKDFKQIEKMRSYHIYHVKKKKCNNCGTKDKLEIHPINYTDKKAFQVLCRKCHRGIGGIHDKK